MRTIKNNILIFFIFIVFVFSNVFPAIPLRAQSQEDELAQLQARMDELQKEIKMHQGNIEKKRKEKRSLQRDISLLKSQISKTKASIEQTGLTIKRIQWQIEVKAKQIKELEEQITKQKQLLAEYIRSLRYKDGMSLLELFLGSDNLSNLFQSVESMEVLQEQIHIAMEQVRENKARLHKEQIETEQAEEEQVAAKKYQEEQKRNLLKKQKRKDLLLRKTKGQEAEYKKMLEQSKLELREVVTKIQLLQSGGQSLTPAQALRLAQYASALTGVRPALLLAVLQQESNLNRNVGSCNYKTSLRGSHVADQPVFEEICNNLGLNPETRLVSCPVMINGKPRGSGGAMGAAQFMPRTWKALESELSSLVGHMPNPWNVQDALVAMGLYLKRNGAASKTFSGERKAAGAYFGRCSFAGIDYCNDVVHKADIWQGWIDKQ